MTASAQTPLVTALQALSQQREIPFHTPGHKRGQGSPDLLRHWLGKTVFQGDLPELPELDNLFAPQGVIQDAQALAAELWGADQTWFLVNGSTCGIVAAVLATCGDGDKLILPRNSHQSAIAAVIQSGAIPIFMEPQHDPLWDLAWSVTPEVLRHTLAQHPDAKAVLLLHPTYHGVCGDLATLTAIAQSYQIPVIVDEAHGSHFAFHPEFPPVALACGADVVIQSTHKTLGAFTQASMLHCQGDRVSGDRISRALQLVQSTSPNYLLLASLDAARHQMATQGHRLWHQTLDLAHLAQAQLASLEGLTILTLPATAPPGFQFLDRTRLTLDVSQWGMTGFSLDDQLREQFGITAELPTLRQLSFILTFGNTEEDIERLIQALTHLAPPVLPAKIPDSLPIALPPAPRVLTPRQAFFAPTEIVSASAAIDRLSAELICPYPPGIPVLIPGEQITPEAIAYLQEVLCLGGMVSGCHSPELHYIRVISDTFC